MNDAVVMKVGYSREGGAYEVCSVGLVVAALATYSIKELSAKGEVRNEVYLSIAKERGGGVSDHFFIGFSCA